MVAGRTSRRRGNGTSCASETKCLAFSMDSLVVMMRDVKQGKVVSGRFGGTGRYNVLAAMQ